MTYIRREDRKSLEEVNRQNLKQLAANIILDAYDELKVEKSVSASRFFGSDWFAYLCSIIRTDHMAIRAAAYSLPGFIPLAERRALQATPMEIAIRRGRKKRRRGKPFAKLTAYPPGGDASPFEINGYVNAAQLIGCSAEAVRASVNQGRPCMGGWRFEKR